MAAPTHRDDARSSGLSLDSTQPKGSECFDLPLSVGPAPVLVETVKVRTLYVWFDEDGCVYEVDASES